MYIGVVFNSNYDRFAQQKVDFFYVLIFFKRLSVSCPFPPLHPAEGYIYLIVSNDIPYSKEITVKSFLNEFLHDSRLDSSSAGKVTIIPASVPIAPDVFSLFPLGSVFV